MSASTQSDQSWCERIFNALDFKSEDSASDFAFEDKPKWVENVLVELMQQTCPSVRLRKFGETTPRKLGLFLGQQCANAYALGAIVNLSPQLASVGKEKLKVLEANRSHAGVQSLLAVLGIVQKLSSHWATEWFPQFEKVLHDAFKEALEQPSHEEAVAFFQGFAKGLSKPGLKNGAAALGTTATVIYQRLFFQWREIDQLQSVPELRRFLIERGLSEQVLGEPERLEKLCERMGLSFRKRGRPRKREKSDATVH